MKLNRAKLLFAALVILAVLCLVYITSSNGSRLDKCIDCNIILITLDSLRADHLGTYGYPRSTSPYIDELAKKSIQIEMFIANGPVTFISLPSMMDSKLPREVTSIRDPNIANETLYYYHIPKGHATLSEILNKHGYDTIAIMNNNITFTNVLKGFKGSDVSHFADDGTITDKSIDAIKNRQGKFFIWIHYISPHLPYRPKEPYNELFINDKHYGNMTLNETILRPFLEDSYDGEDNLDYYISQYDGEIRFIDSEISRISKAIEDTNNKENTLIIISSDHGESLGEHQSYFSHGLLYDTDIHIPLIIFNPKSYNTGKRNIQMQGIDLAPTILELVGINKEPQFDGLSYFKTIYQNRKIDPVAYSRYETDHFAYRTYTWKYISRNGSRELFNLLNDRNETDNLFMDQPPGFSFQQIFGVDR
jgi:arylsulfatase A-like enzyme